MNWLVGAVVGDVFRWLGGPGAARGTMCRITGLRDADLEVHFEYLTGDLAGRPGYTILPQDVELVSAIEQLGELV